MNCRINLKSIPSEPALDINITFITCPSLLSSCVQIDTISCYLDYI